DAPKPQADDQEFSPDMRDDQDTWDEDTSPGITIGDAEILSSPESKLDEELQGWGVSIPDPINKGQVAMGEIPPVIDESEEDFSDHQSTVLAIKEDEETVYPDNNELDYPDLDLVGSTVTPKTNLISIDQLSMEQDEEEF